MIPHKFLLLFFRKWWDLFHKSATTLKYLSLKSSILANFDVLLVINSKFMNIRTVVFHNIENIIILKCVLNNLNQVENVEVCFDNTINKNDVINGLFFSSQIYNWRKLTLKGIQFDYDCLFNVGLKYFLIH